MDKPVLKKSGKLAFSSRIEDRHFDNALNRDISFPFTG
jgi:hypothetical protein